MSRLRGEQYPAWLKQLFEDSTNLLPSEWHPAKRWIDLKPCVGEKRMYGTGPIVRNRFSEDEWWQERFPPRAKKDLSIRRLRWPDVFDIAKVVTGESEFRRRLDQLRGLDYIYSLNIMLSGLMFGRDWWMRWEKRGTWTKTLDDLTADLRYVSDEIKKHGIADVKEWTQYVELASLNGYKNHFEGDGFDKVAMSKDLAQGEPGPRTSPNPEEDWITAFKRVARKTLMEVPLDGPEFLPFEAWFEKVELWETGGSSSYGKMHWRFGDEEGEFKIRKNLFADVEDLKKWAKICYTQYKQTNVAIEKNELGKIRIAVAGDIVTYFRQAYIMYLCNHWYKHWPGSTIEEDSVTQFKRMSEMLDIVKTHHSLPFDYKAFDHQPWLDEILALVDLFHERAMLSVPLEWRADVRKLLDLDRLGFKNAVLEVVEQRGEQRIEHVFAVLLGVMSGLRYTTILGNAWNTVMTEMAKEYISAAGVPVPVKSWIRGDDSAIFTPNYYDALLIRQSLQTVGAVGNDMKFGIHAHATEFLRTWFADRCHGYAGRMIPNLVQRKPWSAEPLDPADQWTVYRGIIDALVRRGCDPVACITVWSVLTEKYAQRNNINKNVFGTPRALGGLGVEEFTSMETVGPVPKTAGLRVQFEKTTDFREKQWRAKGEALGYALTDDRVRALVEEDRMAKVSGDDIMSFSAAVRPRLREEMRLIRARPASDDYCPHTVIFACDRASEPHPHGEDWLKYRLQSLAEDLEQYKFGALAHLATVYQDLKRMDPELTIRDTFKKIDLLQPGNALLTWQEIRKYLPPMHAKDWVLGSALSSQPSGRNGMFDKLVSYTVMFAITQTWNLFPFRRENVSLQRTVSHAVARVSRCYALQAPVALVDGW
jgi:hypothetical protein